MKRISQFELRVLKHKYCIQIMAKVFGFFHDLKYKVGGCNFTFPLEQACIYYLTGCIHQQWLNRKKNPRICLKQANDQYYFY